MVCFIIRRIRVCNLTRTTAGLSKKLIRIADIFRFKCYCEFVKFIETFIESADTGRLSEY